MKAQLLGIILLLAISPASHPHEVDFGSPDTVPNQLRVDRSNFEFLKAELYSRGLQLGLDYSVVGLAAQNNQSSADDAAASGIARFYGEWEHSRDDLGNGAALVWKAEHRHSYTRTAPRDLLLDVGVLGVTAPPFSDQGSRLTNLYWKQRFNNGRSVVIAGFLDSKDFLDAYALGSPWAGFLNSAFSTGTATVALPGDAALGVAAGTMLGSNFFVLGGLTDMNADPKKPLDGFDSVWNESKFFKSLELGWTSDHWNIHTDKVHVTLWHADDSEVQGSSKGWGMNLSATRQWGQWLPFLRAGYSEDNGALFERSVSVGTGYFGLGGKHNKLGIGLNWGEVPGASDQFTAEVFYLIKPLAWLEISPDIQWVANPALNPGEDSLFIFGLRGRVHF